MAHTHPLSRRAHRAVPLASRGVRAHGTLPLVERRRESLLGGLSAWVREDDRRQLTSQPHLPNPTPQPSTSTGPKSRTREPNARDPTAAPRLSPPPLSRAGNVSGDTGTFIIESALSYKPVRPCGDPSRERRSGRSHRRDGASAHPTLRSSTAPRRSPQSRALSGATENCLRAGIFVTEKKGKTPN